MTNENEFEDVEDRGKTVSTPLTEDTREMLKDLKSAYRLETFDDAVRFAIENMKKVTKPKTMFD